MINKNNDKEMRVLKIEINKNNKYYNILDSLCFRAKNLYNTAMYYTKNHYIATKNIHDNKENHENATNIMNEIHDWIKEYNYKTHLNNLEIINKNIKYNIDKIELEFNCKDYNSLVSDYKSKVKELNADIKGKKIEKPLGLLRIQNKWYGEFVDRNIMDKFLKTKDEFKALNSDSASKIITLVENVWKSYFESLTGYTKNPSLYTGLPKMPNYKKRGDFGRQVFMCRRCYTIEDIGNDKYYNLKLDKADFKNSGIELKIPLKEKLNMNLKEPISEIRLIPRNDKINIEIVYNIGKNENIIDNNNVIAIDIGVNRLATICNNIKVKPIAINGLPLKSMNNHWNKESAKYKSVLKTTNNKDWSKKLELITNHRNNYINTYMHKASSMIVKWCLEYNISKVIIGKNKGWKQGCNIGKETQTFVQIPFAKFIEMLEYKCKEKGMSVIIQEESYTSKASFIDNEYIATYGKDDISYKKRRYPRGMYTSDKGLKIHSDLNGAYNILRKYDDTFTYDNNFLHPYILNVG